MPNYCENKLTISHRDADVIDNLMAQVRADDRKHLFKYIKPMPEGYMDDDRWYNWSIDNWGTKWDAMYMTYTQHDDHNVSFDFNTAWSPPLQVYQELTEQGFEVEAYYVEYGMMFAGEWHSDKEGEIIDEYINDITKGVTDDLDEELQITQALREFEEQEKALA